MSRSTRFIALSLVTAGLAVGCATSEAAEPDPESDRVEILAPSHGEVIQGESTFVVSRPEIDITGATTPGDEGGGWWLVAGGCVDVGEALPFFQESIVAVPADSNEVVMALPVGVHDVCLQFATAEGITYYNVDEITVRVTA